MALTGDSNNIVIDGFGGPFIVSNGLGDDTLDILGPPDGAIIDVDARIKSLFITQFRQLREIP